MHLPLTRADAIQRFRNETLRVFDVLEIQLSGRYTGEPRDYLAGNGKGAYSIADIKVRPVRPVSLEIPTDRDPQTWAWVKGHERGGFTAEEMGKMPHLLAWIDRIAKRPAVQRGVGEAYNMS